MWSLLLESFRLGEDLCYFFGGSTSLTCFNFCEICFLFCSLLLPSLFGMMVPSHFRMLSSKLNLFLRLLMEKQKVNISLILVLLKKSN